MTKSVSRILGLIPARGGSKGVARKNIRSLDGKPLLQYTTEVALAAQALSQVVLSTDDDEIAELGRRCGVTVPFIRPAQLAQDDTPMLPVVQHALRYLEDQGEVFDAVCLLQPTNPLRRTEDIDECIRLLESSGADAVVTVLPVPSEYNPHWTYFRDQRNNLSLCMGDAAPITRRQDLPRAFHREGSVYVTRSSVIMKDNSLYGKRTVGYEVDARWSINIDSPGDWERAEALLAACNNESQSLIQRVS
jgi:CMP-N,N'-diacetyllegionaminic acid synthase